MSSERPSVAFLAVFAVLCVALHYVTSLFVADESRWWVAEPWLYLVVFLGILARREWGRGATKPGPPAM